ncbi:DNA polymerase III subunit delta' [Rhizomicrobium electricum]|uniref:DNA polymerase III subunit delta n=1 Tax=Rhizomicrobium electricum TaxID=480070 RepID=A0ABP3Q3P2_9PROT|nr:DNA polymerase III subunit delta' [Rhizomicrobium electricum]NIJ50181.1 DNA polymerase-3 subunit delta' [Rhizomicrobium electricum]
MAPRKARVTETVELDRAPGAPHPRETTRLVGQDAALAIVSRAIRGQRPPQAWLICGPPGVGKATLAYRVARYLLAYGAKADGPEDLAVPANDPAAVQIVAGSHPGLLVLKRGYNDEGKLMTVLGVDVVRRLNSFFGMTSGAGGWRAVIVDTADDMNDQAANALLKLLEEPPAKAMLFVLSNTPGRLLPTIRSRCQRLTLRPLSDADMTAELERLMPDTSTDDRNALVKLSGGSLGAALRLSGGEGVALAQEAAKLIDRASAPDITAIMQLSDKLARITDGLDMLGDFLVQNLTARIRDRALAGQPGLNKWVDALERLRRTFARTDALHLEPRQTLLSAARDLNATARRAGTV